jgi:hypothetical protein
MLDKRVRIESSPYGAELPTYLYGVLVGFHDVNTGCDRCSDERDGMRAAVRLDGSLLLSFYPLNLVTLNQEDR